MAHLALIVCLLCPFQDPVVGPTPRPDSDPVTRERPAQETPPPTKMETSKTVENVPLPTEERKPRFLRERGPLSGPSLTGFVLWSGVVIGILVGVFIFFRRFSKNSRLFGAHPVIDILGRRSLAPRQELFLVETGGKVFLIGATKDRLTTLGEINDPDQVALVKSKVPGRKEDTSTAVFQKSLSEGLRDYEKGVVEKPARYEGLLEELSSLKKTVSSWKS